jgi:hypothetical protein
MKNRIGWSNQASRNFAQEYFDAQRLVQRNFAKFLPGKQLVLGRFRQNRVRTSPILLVSTESNPGQTSRIFFENES